MNINTILYGLAYKCLYDNRLFECPLFCMEEKSFAEKLALINKMDEEEKQEILLQHASCKNKHNGYEKW